MILLDPETFLPHVIRSFEDHAIFGLSKNDLLLWDYTEVSGMKFAQRREVIYNEDSILEETTLTNIVVNPDFADGFFDGLPADKTDTTPAPPKKVKGYGHAELTEFFQNTLWGGEYAGTLANLSVTKPADDLPGVHVLLFKDNPILEQIVLEFDDSVIVYEAPPHQTDLVIQWVNETLGRQITHFYVSHQT
jgi:hypothetical protein